MSTSRIAQVSSEWFGLFALTESARVKLPLKGVECEFSARGGLVEVCLSQIFRQENPRPLGCEYLFPLPADAAVYSCEAEINGRIIRAEIREREEARQFAAARMAEGFRTALVESERDNLFTLGLGNLQPDDVVIVRLKYFQPLRTLGETRSLEIPFCPGVRYIPGKPLLRSNRGKGIEDDTDEVPDASRISPVRIDAGHPDAAYVDVRGTLDGKFADRQSVTSPSHAIDLDGSAGEFGVTLSSKGEVPDRDFVLRWKECAAETVAPRAWLQQWTDGLYALMEVRAPKSATAGRDPMDLYFLVDRSGSMQGRKWNQAVAALQSCVNVLAPDDRVMITFFETAHQDFAEAPQFVRDVVADPQFQNLRRLGTGGGTNLEPALQHVLEVAARQTAGRTRNLILITDAQIGNEQAILKLMKSAPDMAVHSFGIDLALNDALLVALSRQQGGTFHSLNPNDDIRGMVTNLGQTLCQPVLLDLRLAEGWEAADLRIPDLYAGQIVYLSAKTRGETPVELTARTPAGEQVRFQFERQPSPVETPYLLWCKHRIQRALTENRSDEAVELSIASNLLCRATAFVAWDSAEKVVIARHDLVQPSQMLHASGNLCAFASSPAGLREDITPERSAALYLSRNLQSRAPTAASGQNDSRICKECFGPETPDELFGKFKQACSRLGGDDWQGLYNAIHENYLKTTLTEFIARFAALAGLIQKIETCAALREGLAKISAAAPGDLEKQVADHTLQCVILQVTRGAALRDSSDCVEMFRLAGEINSAQSASAESLNRVMANLRKKAIEIIKAFAESLSARK